MIPGGVYLLAELDGVVAGSGLSQAGRAFGYAGLHPRVLPAVRRRRRRHRAAACTWRRTPSTTASTQAGTNVDDPGSLAFAERFGFEEVDRQVEQVRDVARGACTASSPTASRS